MKYTAPEAKITWKDGTSPLSEEYQDIYYPAGAGIEACRHVFLEPNELPDRFLEAKRFTIGELGFGTGLNFLVTIAEWIKSSRPSSHLHFISFEKAPLSREDLKRALGAFPEIAPYREIFLERYPNRLRGFHRIHFPEWRASLTLFIGDALEGLRQIREPVQAWYLDGFAPTKNEDLWSKEILERVAQLSQKGATLGTFSSAGFLKRELEVLGFRVEKFPGLRGKRESIRAVSLQGKEPEVFAAPDALVIGGGIAGTAVAHALARRGMRVQIIERGSELASGASGNPRGVILPYITEEPSLMSRFYLAAFEFALLHYREVEQSTLRELYLQSGVVHLPSTRRLTKLLANLSTLDLPTGIASRLSPVEASEKCGLRLDSDAFWYPRGGVLDPREAAKAHLEAFRDQCKERFETGVDALIREGDRWVALDASGAPTATAPFVILANAYEAKRLSQTAWLPVEPVRGQALVAHTEHAMQALKTVLCYDGFITPAQEGAHFLGATYEHNDLERMPRPEQSRDLLKRLARVCPASTLSERSIGEVHVRFRTSTFDRLPFVGPASTLPEEAGLHLAVGFGSRGLMSCPIAAEILAAHILGETFPVESDLVNALQPSRYDRARATSKPASPRQAHQAA